MQLWNWHRGTVLLQPGICPGLTPDLLVRIASSEKFANAMGEREPDECPPTTGNDDGNADIKASPVPIVEVGGHETCFWGESKMVRSSLLYEAQVGL